MLYKLIRTDGGRCNRQDEVIGYTEDLDSVPKKGCVRMEGMLPVMRSVEVVLCEGIETTVPSLYDRNGIYVSGRIQKGKKEVGYVVYRKGLVLVNTKVLRVEECEPPENWGKSVADIERDIKLKTVREQLERMKKAQQESGKYFETVTKQVKALGSRLKKLGER